jgi:hypothetical protein
VGVRRLLVRQRSNLSKAICQAQGGRRIEEGAKGIGHVQEQIDNLGTRFYNDDISRVELLEGLSVFLLFCVCYDE